MTGTVIRVQSEVGGKDYVWVEWCSLLGPVNRSIATLSLDRSKPPFLDFFEPPAPVSATQLAAVGIAIYDALTTNQSIKDVLNAVLLLGPPQAEPLYIYLDSLNADEFPWEVLCNAPPNANHFLALNPGWPIGRIVGQPRGDKTELAFAPPLRVLLVLAAAQVSAAGEWRAIYDAIKASPLEVDLMVMLCEKMLEDEIKALTPRKGLKITTQYVTDGIRFRQALNTFKPNLLHFFCHGLGGAMPKLQLATRPDFDAQPKQNQSSPVASDPPASIGSVEVQPIDLHLASELHNSLWLVTLNCCEGAKSAGAAQAANVAVAAPMSPPQGIHSFARSLVETWGFPAVVGMRERIAVSVANKFSSSFYGAVFGLLNVLLARSQISPPVEWVRMLSAPRSDLQPLGPLPWNLPVLYVRPEDFLIEPSGPDQKAEQVELKVLRNLRDDIGVGMPPEKLEQLNNRIRVLEQMLAA